MGSREFDEFFAAHYDDLARTLTVALADRAAAERALVDESSTGLILDCFRPWLARRTPMIFRWRFIPGTLATWRTRCRLTPILLNTGRFEN